MRTALMALLVLPLTACIVVDGSPRGDGPTGDPCCGSDPGIESASLDVGSVSLEDHTYSVSITDRDGPTSCGLAADEHLELAYDGMQVFTRIQVDWRKSCPEGIYAFDDEGCEAGGVGPGCARVRAWDAQGGITHESFAAGGTLIVEADGWDACRFHGEAVLAGGTILAFDTSVDDLNPWGDQVCSL